MLVAAEFRMLFLPGRGFTSGGYPLGTVTPSGPEGLYLVSYAAGATESESY